MHTKLKARLWLKSTPGKMVQALYCNLDFVTECIYITAAKAQWSYLTSLAAILFHIHKAILKCLLRK